MPKALRPVDGIDPGVIPDVKNVFQDQGLVARCNKAGEVLGRTC